MKASRILGSFEVGCGVLANNKRSDYDDWQGRVCADRHPLLDVLSTVFTTSALYCANLQTEKMSTR